MKHRDVNKKTFKWFYGFMCVSLLVFFLNITRGITASCWDNYDFKTFDKVLFKTTYTELFKSVPYHISLGIYFMVVDFHCAVAWNFNDLFIICISIWLERNFTIFNERIALNIRVKTIQRKIKLFSLRSFQNKSKKFWDDHFNLYKDLCNHITMTSGVLGISILLSFGLNLYFICFRLLLNFK